MEHPALSADLAKLHELTARVARIADRIQSEPVGDLDPAALPGAETAAVVAAADVGALRRELVAALYDWSETASRVAAELADTDQSTAARLGR